MIHVSSVNTCGIRCTRDGDKQGERGYSFPEEREKGSWEKVAAEKVFPITNINECSEHLTFIFIYLNFLIYKIGILSLL